MEKVTTANLLQIFGRRTLLGFAALVVCAVPAFSQKQLAGAPALKQSLDRLRVVGSVMMIAAHPDDENTAFLAWCSKGRKLRTAYLSLTRGEGGQNLIGSEQGPLLGLIRTQELLAARRIDGAEQFFTRAIDFGFSKTADETLQKWGREEVLGDVVWVIRKFRPDVIVLRFSGTPRDGHGHHQSSAILGKEAFRAAADPGRFPEQLKYVQPWQARRIVWNGFAFNRQQEQELEAAKDRLFADAGQYDPVLGYSYAEIAGMSRSQHRSQSMGASERKGSAPNYFLHVDGQPASRDLFEEIDTTWKRIPGGLAVDAALAEAQEAYVIDTPQRTIPALAKARALAAALNNEDARRKVAEIDETIAMAAGLWVEVNAAKPSATPGSKVPLKLTAVARSNVPVTIRSALLEGGPVLEANPVTLDFNQAYTREATWDVPLEQPYSQPLWLREPSRTNMYVLPDAREVGLAEGAPVLTSVLNLLVGESEIVLRQPVMNRYVDRLRGELTRPFVVLPVVTLQVAQNALVFPDAGTRHVPVEVRAHGEDASGTVRLDAPQGWKIEPVSQPFSLSENGQLTSLTFRVTPPMKAAIGSLRAVAEVQGRTIDSGWVSLTYEHIPPQTVLPTAQTRVVRADIKIAARTVGYVMGAGDEVPDFLQQLGCTVALLTDSDLARGDLLRFDAIVTGVRAFNTRSELRANARRLFDYATNGGTVVVQYNVLDGPFFASDPGTLKGIGPYPLRTDRDRVTVEEAPVRFLKPSHTLLHFPNEITEEDFQGWVQERGLYFPSSWDPRYEAILEMNDPGDKPLSGGLLYSRMGKGAYIFSPLAWFRQLPSGVPGAARLFANLVSAGKAPAARASE